MRYIYRSSLGVKRPCTVTEYDHYVYVSFPAYNGLESADTTLTPEEWRNRITGLDPDNIYTPDVVNDLLKQYYGI